MCSQEVVEPDFPKLDTLIKCCYAINAALDQGHADKFTFEGIRNSLEQATIFEDLNEQTGIDFEEYDSDPDSETSKLLNTLVFISNGIIPGREGKHGIGKSGLCLLSVLALSAISHRFWEDV